MGVLDDFIIGAYLPVCLDARAISTTCSAENDAQYGWFSTSLLASALRYRAPLLLLLFDGHRYRAEVRSPDILRTSLVNKTTEMVGLASVMVVPQPFVCCLVVELSSRAYEDEQNRSALPEVIIELFGVISGTCGRLMPPRYQELFHGVFELDTASFYLH